MIEHNLPEKWQLRWHDEGFLQPSLIQERVYEPLAAGESLVGISPTGSGKTLAYLLPTLAKLTPKAGNQLLILTSSQELGIQVANVARKWADDLGLAVQPCIGGANIQRQIEKLKGKPEVLVGTPGRMVELIKLKKIKAHQLQCVVFDEADQLFLPGAMGLTEEILKSLQQGIQLAFFSATADQALPQINKLVQEVTVIDVTQQDQSKGIVNHYYLRYSSRQTVDALRRMAHIKGFQALVFFNQIQDLGSAEEKLLFHQLPVATLASDQSKGLRKLALESFKQGKLVELLTTDVAARGIDILGLPYIVNTEVPLNKESYLHRAGRVGRMGADGQVITLVQDHSLPHLRKIATELSIDIEEIYLHGGAFHKEAPIVNKEPKRTAVKPRITPVQQSKLNEPKIKDKSKNRQKNQKNKGARKKKSK